MLNICVSGVKFHEPVPNIFRSITRTNQTKRVFLQSKSDGPHRFNVANKFLFLVLRHIFQIKKQLVVLFLSVFDSFVLCVNEWT